MKSFKVTVKCDDPYAYVYVCMNGETVDRILPRVDKLIKNLSSRFGGEFRLYEIKEEGSK